MEDARRVLKAVFGYDAFRPGQEQAVRALLEGRDLMAVMPTGAGKSVCYQIPALMRDGITLVISPLISLMRDQVWQLGQAGVRAAYINSTLTPRQQQKAIDYAREGRYRIIYAASPSGGRISAPPIWISRRSLRSCPSAHRWAPLRRRRPRRCAKTSKSC